MCNRLGGVALLSSAGRLTTRLAHVQVQSPVLLLLMTQRKMKKMQKKWRISCSMNCICQSGLFRGLWIRDGEQGM